MSAKMNVVIGLGGSTVRIFYETDGALSTDEHKLSGNPPINHITDFLMAKTVYLSGESYILFEVKKSVAFTLYALRTLYKLPSNVKGATGASKETVLGVITYAK